MTYAPASPIRAGLMMPAHAQFVEAGLLFCGTAGGTANALTASTGKNLTGLIVNQVIGLKTGASANSGAATLNVDGLGAKAIQKNGAALVGGELYANTDVWLQYDGTSWRLIGGGGGFSYPTLAKSSAYTVTAADAGKLIVATGTWPLGLPAASGVAPGFAVAVINVGSGVISLGGTVNGSTTYQVSPYQSLTLVSDGTNWYALGNTATSSEAFSATYKSTKASLSNNALTATFVTSVWASVRATSPVPSGKYYWEVKCDSGGSDAAVGIVDASFTDFETGMYTSVGSYRSLNGYKANGSGGSVAYGSSWTAGDVIGVALDLPGGKIWFAKNGVWQASGDPVAGTNAAFTGLSGTLYPAVGTATNAALTARFQASSFGYTVPSGYSAIP